MKMSIYGFVALLLCVAPLHLLQADETWDKYQQVVTQHGKMSEQANAVREQIIDDYSENRDIGEALPYLRDSWAWYEQQGIKDQRRHELQFKLGKSLRMAGYFDEALPLLKDSYARFVENKGEQAKPSIKTGIELGMVLASIGQHEEAIALLQKQLEYSINVWGDSHGKVAYAHLQLGDAYTLIDQYQLAEKHLKEAFTIFELKKGDTFRVTNIARMKLGRLYREMGRYDDSEKILRKAYIKFSSKPENQQHQLTSHIITQLGRTLMKEGRYVEAEQLLREAVAIQELKLGKTSTKTYQTTLSLVQLLLDEKKASEAEIVAKDVLTRIQGNASEFSQVRARANLLYGRSLLQSDKLDEAEQAYARTKTYLDKSPDDLSMMKAYQLGMGTIKLNRSKYAEAEAYLSQALELTIKLSGDYTPDTTMVKSKLATAYAGQGKFEEAINSFRAAMAASTGFLAQRETFSKVGRAQQEASINEYLQGFMNLMVNAHLSKKKISANPIAESFTIAENTRGQSLQSAMLGMAARAAAGNSYLSDLVRREQDIRMQLGSIDEQMIELVRQAGAANLKEIPLLGRQRKELMKELKDIGVQMGNQYPEYNRLINPPATQLSDVQALLGSDELMLAYYTQDDRTMLWSVSRDAVQLHVVPEGAQALQKNIQKLRASLDVPVATLDDIPAYNLQLANELYQELIAPAGAQLQHVRHLIVVPHGALFSMPFGALVTAKSGVKPTQLPFAEYKSVPWLAEKYAISMMPSATALVTMRKFAKREQPGKPFIGFGDPLFGETINQVAVATRGVRVAQRAAINTRSIKGLPNLPETRAELQKIALTLGATNDSLYLGEAANESNVKKADLKDYRVVAFATHGLVAGDLDGLDQPALALTPPEQGNKDNDGLLQMGEVLELDLNADWVVLSACNTAAGDKALANQGLSGLTQAFFYAGSRALLVSLWPVESTSTQALTTTIFDTTKQNPGVGRAAALQAARKRLIEGEGYIHEGKEVFSYAHPIFWSAFIAVGEGGIN